MKLKKDNFFDIFPYFVFACVLICEILTVLPVTKESNEKITEKAEICAVQTDIPLNVAARSAVLIDARTGDVLFSKKMDEKLPMASTTKIMTALCVIESGIDLETPFAVTPECVGTEGSSIYLKEGEIITVRELLYGLLLESGNDAACALAVCTEGSIENFTALMNKKACEMGLSATHFDNPHGLYTETHRTTAYELAKITSHAMKNPVFREIAATKSYFIPERRELSARYFSNHNKLLRSEKDCIGVKTGYTKACGRCLVSAVSRENGEFIAVTLDDSSDWHDHRKMFEYANNFVSVRIAARGGFSYCIHENKKCALIGNPEDIYITLNTDEYRKYTENGFSAFASIQKNSIFDADKNDIAGSLEICIADKKRSFPLVLDLLQ